MSRAGFLDNFALKFLPMTSAAKPVVASCGGGTFEESWATPFGITIGADECQQVTHRLETLIS